MDKTDIMKIRILHGDSMPINLDDALLIVFGLQGQTTVHTTNGDYCIEKAMVYMVSPHALYRITCPKTAAALCMEVSPQILQLAGWTNQTKIHCYLNDSNAKDSSNIAVLQGCAFLFRAFLGDSDASELASKMIDFANFIRRHFRDEERKQDAEAFASWSRMEEILRYIHTHWNEAISVTSLASKHFLSEGHLSRMFRRFLDMTFTQYLVTVRLEHALEDLDSEKTITQIAYDNGFKSVNSFIAFFSRKHHQTPGQYRTHKKDEDAIKPNEASSDPTEWMQVILQYDDAEAQTSYPKTAPEVQESSIDIEKNECILHHSWRSLLNIGYARDGLIGTVQHQITRATKEIGFTHLRFHGIFDEDMHIYQESEDGAPWYNFTYADLLFDFILSVGLTPYIELSYIPIKLTKVPYRLFERQSYVSMYNNEEKWEALVQATVAHWIERYGLETVVHWRFTILSYNYAQLPGIPLSYEEYLEMYCTTYRAIKTLDPRIQLGGPGGMTSITMSPNGLNRLLADLSARACRFDFITVQCYPHENVVDDYDFLKFTANQLSTPSVISKNENFLNTFLEDFHQLLESHNMQDSEIVIEECNSTLWQRDLSSDTCYKSAWLVKNILQNCNRITMFGYWLLSDFIEEWSALGGVFHGGYGLLTASGIPKASYRAMQMLNEVGNTLVASSDNWTVTRNKDRIQVFCYHYCHYDALYRYRYQKLKNPNEAYTVFKNKSDIQLTLELNNLSPGIYRRKHYAINRTAGSSFDQWLAMGAPTSMRPDDLQYLSERSQPYYHICDYDTTGKITLQTKLSAHEVQVFIFEKRD